MKDALDLDFAAGVVAVLAAIASALLAVGTFVFGLFVLMVAGDGWAATPTAALPTAVANRPAAAGQLDPAIVERGRYLVRIAGCNDCHTPGYVESGGKVPIDKWLIGDRLGWRGPWGTSYPTNLRRLLGPMSEKDWLHLARTMEPRPPMPWFNVRAMSDSDLGAIWQFVQSLGPAGDEAPAWVPPDKVPPQPYVQFPQ